MGKKIINNNIVYIPDEEKYMNCASMVVHVILPQPEGSIGGSDTHVLNLSAQQKADGEFLPIVLFRNNNSYRRMLEERGIAYIDGSYYKNLRKLARSLKEISNNYPIKLVHSHQYSANYLTYFLKKKNKREWGDLPTVMTCHGWIENNVKDRIATMLDFYTYKVATGLIAVCEKDKKRLCCSQKNKMITCIRNGVEIVETFKTSDEIDIIKKRYELPLDKKILAIVGRLSPEKRIDIFLKFAYELLKIRNDVCFIVVGEGAEKSKLISISRELGIEKFATFIGFVENMEEIYSMIDLLLLTSDTEGTPRVVLECMAHKKSVIATDVGGLKEIIKNNESGILVKKGDYLTMAKEVNRLLEDVNCLALQREEAYKTICCYFSLRKMQEEINQFYNMILNRAVNYA